LDNRQHLSCPFFQQELKKKQEENLKAKQSKKERERTPSKDLSKPCFFGCGRKFVSTFFEIPSQKHRIGKFTEEAVWSF
jgi:hypothetical protein